MQLFPHNKPYVYKLLSIDPGGHKTGVTLFELDLTNSKILSAKAWTINVDKLFDDTALPVEMIGEKFHRYYKLRNELARTFRHYKPDAIGYEGPFMNKLQPTAYGPLVSMMTLIMDALMHYNPGIPFHVIQPQQTKKAVGVAGKKGKDVIKEAIKKIPEVMEALKVTNCELDDLDDNAIDSIGVGLSVMNIHLLPEKDYAKYLPTR